jgi:hypothetical protein
MSEESLIPPEEEGDIVIKGSYMASNGMEIPVNIHTNKSGMIYRHWRAELERRSGGVRKLEEGQIYEIDPIVKEVIPERPPAREKPKERGGGKTRVQVFIDEDRRQILARLGELRSQLRLTSTPEGIREEILELEKRLLGDP